MSLRVGIAQFPPCNDLTKNYEIVEQHISQLKLHGAELVVIPELWTCEYNMATVKDHLEPIPGQSTDFLCSLAKQHSLYIIGGTIPEVRGSQIYNTCPVISSDGAIIGTYSKRHLYKANIPGKVTVDEGDVFTPGTDAFSFSIGAFKIGVCVCFDVRFAGFVMDYVLKEQCNLIVFPSAFTKHTGEMHWELLGRARAIDTQSWIVMVSSSYDPDAGFKAIGRSFVV